MIVDRRFDRPLLSRLPVLAPRARSADPHSAFRNPRC